MDAPRSSSQARPATPDFLRAIIDDAAIFPPGNAPLDRALAEHREHQNAEYADLVGPFLVSDIKLPDLIGLLGPDQSEQPVRPDGPLPVNVIVTGGAGAIDGAVRWAGRAEQIDLRGLEFALRDEDDLAHNAQRVLAALDAVGDQLGDATVYVEPPRLHGGLTAGWLAALDELAAREIPLKFRTGGVDEDDYPTPVELAGCIDAALDRELPFKCTAGLHHAIRDGNHHGFLNVLVATSAALEGNDIVAALAETDPAVLVELAVAEGVRARRWFRSFGSCSILEPHDDLVELGLVKHG